MKRDKSRGLRAPFHVHRTSPRPHQEYKPPVKVLSHPDMDPLLEHRHIPESSPLVSPSLSPQLVSPQWRVAQCLDSASMCSVCPFSWCQHPHHGGFQATHVRSLHREEGRDHHPHSRAARRGPCSFPYLLTHLDGFAKVSGLKLGGEP